MLDAGLANQTETPVMAHNLPGIFLASGVCLTPPAPNSPLVWRIVSKLDAPLWRAR
jgi:hypothetical protein